MRVIYGQEMENEHAFRTLFRNWGVLKYPEHKMLQNITFFIIYRYNCKLKNIVALRELKTFNRMFGSLQQLILYSMDLLKFLKILSMSLPSFTK